jgi:hypothetical protein
MKAVMSWAVLCTALLLASLFIHWLPTKHQGAAVIGLLLAVNLRLLWNIWSNNR